MATPSPRDHQAPSESTPAPRGAPAAPAPKRNGGAARWIRRLLLVLGLAAVATLVAVALVPKPVPVDLGRVSRGALEVVVEEDGRARVKDRYVVSAPLMGNLARIELDPGDAVKAGDVLARIVPLDPALLDARSRAQAEARVAAAAAQKKQVAATIERVRTALEFARREAERQRTLTASGAVSERAVERASLEERTLQEELASAQLGAKVAEHELKVAKAVLGHATGKPSAEDHVELTAPIDGRVLRVVQQSEGAVQPGTPLMELGNPAALEIVVDVLTTDATRIAPGATVRIQRWGGEGALPAHVRLVEPSAFTRVSALGVEEQRVNVVIDLDAEPERYAALGDGYRVEAEIVVWHGDDVLQLPTSAVFRHDGGWAVFHLEADHVQRVPVELGRRNSYEAELVSGLQDGAQVVVHPSDRVEDGVKVEPRK